MFALLILGAIGIATVVTVKGIKIPLLAETILDILDLLTTIVPPVLPAALAASVIYAQSHLAKFKIYCISPSTINLAGTLNCFVFDKTGTLTEDGLDLKYVVPVQIDEPFGYSVARVEEFKADLRVVHAMASCHSLTFLNEKLAGDPLDLKLFEFTKWTMIEPHEGEEQNTSFDFFVTAIVQPIIANNQERMPSIGISKQFPFSSSLQRMSVVVRDANESNFVLYTKGSPEKISELCRPETSI